MCFMHETVAIPHTAHLGSSMAPATPCQLYHKKGEEIILKEKDCQAIGPNHKQGIPLFCGCLGEEVFGGGLEGKWGLHKGNFRSIIS